MSEQQSAGESASSPKAAVPSGEVSSGQLPAGEPAASAQPPGTGPAATEPPGTEPAASASTTAGEATSQPSSVPDTGGTRSLPAVFGETSAQSGATTSQAPDPGARTREGETRGEGSSPAAAGLAAAGGVRPEEPDPAGASNGPKKPVLAGAAIAGAVLVTIPVLLLGSASDDEKKSAAVSDAAANTVLDEEGPDQSGAFVPQPSSPPSKRASATPPLSKEPAREVPPATRRQDSGTTARDRSKATPRRASARRTGATGPDLSRVLIKNWKNQTCVDIPALGKGVQDGPVNQSTCNSTAEDNQLWNLEAASSGSGPGGAKLYVIRNVKDGQCLDLPYYGGAGATTRITEYPCNRTTGDNQLWWLQKRANNTYWIRNHASSDLCLDVAGSNDRRRDVRLTLFYCSDTDDQNWLFTSR